METNRTIKIWTHTYHQLRVLAALTGETMSATLERLVRQERERVEHEQRRKGTIPLDQHAQFRSAVRAVLTILLDEGRHPAERVTRATAILLGLPVPMPQVGTRERQSAERAPTLYRAGPDGLPTTTEYTPAPEEGPLTEEAVASMRREQREGYRMYLAVVWTTRAAAQLRSRSPAAPATVQRGIEPVRANPAVGRYDSTRPLPTTGQQIVSAVYGLLVQVRSTYRGLFRRTLALHIEEVLPTDRQGGIAFP